jgi:predicted DNA-binding transcriptional regulator AlpA
MNGTQELIGTKAVSEWLGIPEETLRYWRHIGSGPASFKLGRRVVYERAECQRWLDAQRAATLAGGQVA